MLDHLLEIFKQVIPEPSMDMDTLLNQISLANQAGDLNSEQLGSIIQGLKDQITYQINIKECWQSLGCVQGIKSIYGLLDQFKYVTKIMDSEILDNPAMNLGLYQVD